MENKYLQCLIHSMQKEDALSSLTPVSIHLRPPHPPGNKRDGYATSLQISRGWSMTQASRGFWVHSHLRENTPWGCLRTHITVSEVLLEIATIWSFSSYPQQHCNNTQHFPLPFYPRHTLLKKKMKVGLSLWGSVSSMQFASKHTSDFKRAILWLRYWFFILPHKCYHNFITDIQHQQFPWP